MEKLYTANKCDVYCKKNEQKYSNIHFIILIKNIILKAMCVLFEIKVDEKK